MANTMLVEFHLFHINLVCSNSFHMFVVSDTNILLRHLRDVS